MTEGNMKNVIPNDVKAALELTLGVEIKKLDCSKLKADKNNVDAQSGNTMFVDLKRMHNTLIINGRKMTDDSNNKEEKKSLIDKAMKEVDESLNLLYELDYGNKYENYHPYLKEVFEKIFQRAGAKVPNDHIIQELIVNCNQAGYDALLHTNILSKIAKHDLIALNPKKTTYIDYINHDCVKIRSNMITPLCNLNDMEGKQISLNSLLEFKLQFQENEVKYTDSKLSLTFPKSLLDRIIEWFKELFGIEIKGLIIEHSFDEQEKPRTEMEVGRVESLPVHQEGI